jgi:putative membrane protein
MKRFAHLACAVVAAVSIAACAGDRNPRTDETATGATGTTGTAGTSADVDRDWINDQLADGDLDVRLGRLAQERGGSADVRAFGAMMVEKHTMAGTELKRIADRHNVPADDSRREKGDDTVERLSKLSGDEFDRAFLDLMVDEHEDAVDALERKARDDGEHADVKEWAAKTLPEVRQHLERAKELRGRLDR